ncbi:MAG: proline dehydrogenase family protein [Bacteroidia bacterium]|nr:proline dehydrogenase family protein [Bacteroidia bacterium]
MSSPNLNFSDTEIAFKTKTNGDLRNSYLLFKAISYNWLVQTGPKLVNFGFWVKLPLKGIIKATVFKQFCGGENIEECQPAIELMGEYGVGTILDYSVEGEEREEVFDATAAEIIKTIEKAYQNPKIPFSVFKVTGIARFDLLAKVNAKLLLDTNEQAEFDRVKSRIDRICQTAFNLEVRVFIDAEESWIQDTIDLLAENMMMLYNKVQPIVYNTLQFYRHDRLSFLKLSIAHATKQHYYYGVKLVRGAYMEKEIARAREMGYQNPIQSSKQASDEAYNNSLQICTDHIDIVAICAGTHNEESCKLLTAIMDQKGLKNNDERIYFSQLYGMSDNLSYNLANAGYKVAKYLPYGPVKAVLPYLFRRAQENTSVKGQAGRELSLIETELKRRKTK